jgi:hypothetical protein
MTEAEWIVSTDPLLMLGQLGERFSDRKVRLFTCAWASLLWGNLADEGREAVLAAERYADGLTSWDELSAAFRAAHSAWMREPTYTLCRKATGLARMAADPRLTRKSLISPDRMECNTRTMLRLADALRELFGPLPFRPIRVEAVWLACNGGAAAALAAEICADAAFDHLPILADALEDGGCDDADLLGHLRSAGPHLRGCWALDLVLGRS